MKTVKCPYCDLVFDANYKVKDHIVPKSKEGTDDPENLIDCCKDCNGEKYNWDVRKVIGENSTREARIETIRKFLKWKKGPTKNSDHPYMKGYN